VKEELQWAPPIIVLGGPPIQQLVAHSLVHDAPVQSLDKNEVDVMEVDDSMGLLQMVMPPHVDILGPSVTSVTGKGFLGSVGGSGSVDTGVELQAQINRLEIEARARAMEIIGLCAR
ncbi:hypothetical protein KI387_014855, partial [Taxus chinensis]